jgi:hypothetical protein
MWDNVRHYETLWDIMRQDETNETLWDKVEEDIKDSKHYLLYKSYTLLCKIVKEFLPGHLLVDTMIELDNGNKLYDT